MLANLFLCAFHGKGAGGPFAIKLFSMFYTKHERKWQQIKRQLFCSYRCYLVNFSQEK